MKNLYQGVKEECAMQDIDNQKKRLDRRTLLQITGASTVTGALAMIAGCSQNQEGTGNGNTPTNDDSSGNGTDTNSGSTGHKRVPEVNFVTWTQSGSPDVFESSRIITNNLEQLGLKVKLDPQQFPQPLIKNIFETRDFDISAIPFLGSSIRIDPSFYLNTVLHSSASSSGGWNFAAWKNEEFDKLAEQQQETLDQNERQKFVKEAQKIAFEEQAMTVYSSPNNAIGLNTNRFKKPPNAKTVPGESLLGPYTLVNIEPKGSDKVLSLANVNSSFGTINPMKVQEAGVNQFIRPIYDTLMRVGPNGKAEPWIIDGITLEDDTTVKVQLMDSLKFHDGESVTAEDVKFSFEYHGEHKSPYYNQFLSPIDSISTSGDLDVTFTLANPYAPFQMLTLGIVPIIPKHIWGNRSNPGNHQNKPAVGSGPFEYKRFESGSVLEMTANKNHPKSPNIDGVLIQLFGNNASAQQSLLQEEIDGFSDVPASLQSEVEKSDSVELYFKPSHSIETFSHNTRKGMPYSDVAFRRAVAHATPNKGISQQIYNGHANPGGSAISKANKFWHNSELGHFEYDIEKAKSILSDAGYKWDDDGRLMMPTSN